MITASFKKQNRLYRGNQKWLRLSEVQQAISPDLFGVDARGNPLIFPVLQDGRLRG